MAMPDTEDVTAKGSPAAFWPITSAEDRLSTLAHELRGRLQVLMLNTDIMLDGAGDTDHSLCRGWLSDRLGHQAKVLRSTVELMERLLDLQVTEHSSEVAAQQRVDLRALVSDILQSDCESLRAARCSWSLQAPVAVAGYWDAIQLRVAISNLIGNAIKFGPGKPVEIGVGCREGSAFVRVTDHGVGLPAEDSERIFGRFERANARVRGAGLGLWLVRVIARAHGGEVTVSSAVGEGATFTVTLPGGRADT
jgi:signal transduction histidine kinase